MQKTVQPRQRLEASSEGPYRSSDAKINLLCLAISILIFFVDMSIPLGVAIGVPYILVVLVSLWSSNPRLPYFAAAAGTVLTIIGLYSSPVGGELWKVLSNRALAIFAIWITAVLSVERKAIQLQRELALSRLKVLAGLLPICASCKKIRDDSGYWNQIEAYISDHSEAYFSHGICPDCVEKLYLDLGKTA